MGILVLRLLALPVVSEEVGGLASSSTDAVEVVTRVTDSSSDVAGVVIRVAGMLSNPEGVIVQTAGSSAGRGSVGLGWVVSLTSTPGNPCVRPSNTSQSLKVMYCFICHLNLCMHIPKWQGSLGSGRSAFSAQY